MWEKMCINSLIVKLITIASSFDSLFWCDRVDEFEVGGDSSLSVVDAQGAKLNLGSKAQHPSAARGHHLECLDDSFGLGVSQM